MCLDYGKIIEEIRRKLERCGILEPFSPLKREDLIILIPHKVYDFLKWYHSELNIIQCTDSYEYYTVFGVKAMPANVDKIFVGIC